MALKQSISTTGSVNPLRCAHQPSSPLTLVFLFFPLLQDHEIEENGGELPETTVYDYNDIRKKVSKEPLAKWHIHSAYLAHSTQPFPWAADGKNNSFFFNPKANRNVEL